MIQNNNSGENIIFEALCVSGGVVTSWLVYVRLQIKWSGFKPSLGPLCCVLGQDALVSQCLSPPRCINGYCKVNAGGNPVMGVRKTRIANSHKL